MPPPEVAPPSLPPTLVESAGFLLGKAAQRAAARMERALDPFGLKARHYGVLVVLDEHGAGSQQEIADRLALDRTTMAAIVDDLERLGFARRHPHPRNRRAHEVRLTPVGEEILPRLVETVAGVEGALLAPLTPAQRAQLRALLAPLAGLTTPPNRPGAETR